MLGKLFSRKKTEVDTKWRIGLLVAFIGMLIVNGLAGSTTILGGQTTANVSNTYENLFTPAGLTFSIWSVIYLLLIGFCAYVWGLGRTKKLVLKVKELESVTKLMIINFLANMSWILAWQYEILWLSVILIAIILVTLALATRKLRGLSLSLKEYALVRLPISVYFGWISIAIVANVATFLVSIQWNGWGVAESVWTTLVLIVAALIGLIIALRNNDAAYLVVFIWAFFGILLRHLSPEGLDGQYQDIIITLTVLLAVLVSQVVSFASPKIVSSR